MVAYSFQKRFAEPILDGTKCQTIRAPRKRHARPGEELQLYTGMRTTHCRLIKRVRCIYVSEITILFDDQDEEHEGIIVPGCDLSVGLEGFARRDGFESWADLKAFWREHHPGVNEFHGFVIRWEAYER